MEPTDYGIIGIIALTVMILLGVRIFVAAGIVGFCGLWALRGFDVAVGVSGHVPFSDTTNYALSVLPLFILIGFLAHNAGIVQGAYRCARAWLGWMPGGLGIATVFASAGFAAVSGASTATSAVFARIAIPELLRVQVRPRSRRRGGRRRRHPRLADPAVGDHGRVRHHHRDLGRPVAAGRVHPGAISAALYAAVILVRFKMNPDLGQPITGISWSERFSTLPEVLPIVLVIVAVLGGMYTGWATPTEVGALGAFIIFVDGAVQTGRCRRPACCTRCWRPPSSR